jgi:hypothetical protein
MSQGSRDLCLDGSQAKEVMEAFHVGDREQNARRP